MKLHSLLNKIGLKNSEIDTMININKALQDTNPEIVFRNLIAVSDAGFPDDELNWLCYNNPSFLTLETKQLKNKIQEIKSKHPDFEFCLKENPDLI